MNIIENIQQKASLLNQLKTDENALFEYINKNQVNLEEVIEQYKPEKEFKPVNTLRFLIANELQKGTVINKAIIYQLKKSLENRDVSEYHVFNEEVTRSLSNYKNSKSGMFPNWKQNFKILFPFIHSNAENDEVKKQLNQLADEVVSFNQLENVTKHIVSFQGSNNYGTDWVWMAIIPKSSPSVQYAYQIFINIDEKGLLGGIHKGHNLVKQQFDNEDIRFGNWDEYLKHTKQIKGNWKELNSKIDFILLNDEKEFKKVITKTDSSSLITYFDTLDGLKDDLNFQDEENLVFSVASNQISFQVGKRYCLALKKDKFRFITSDSYTLEDLPKEVFKAPESAFLYNSANASQVTKHYEAIKDAIESEIERDNHTEAKSYDNSAFRKSVFDKDYRDKILSRSGEPIKYYVVGAYWDSYDPKDQTKHFVKEEKWINGYTDKFNGIVNKINEGDRIAIKSTYVREKTKSVMLIKARGIVQQNLKDGQNLKVKWEPDFEPFEVDFTGGYRATVKQVKDKSHIKLIWSNNGIMINEKFNKSENYLTKSSSYSPSLNQIFYGPPGTGKTYNTILEAAKILVQDPDISYSDAKEIFRDNLGDKIEFITFHQNYSYEDFVQGLRPDIENKELSFNRTDGVFARIVTNALFEYYKIYQRQNEPSGNPALKIDLNEAYIEFVNSLSKDQEFETKTGLKIKVDNFTDKQNIEFKPLNGLKSYLVSGNRLLKLYNVFKDINEIKRLHEDIREAIGGCNSSIYYVALREFISFLSKYEKTLKEFAEVDDGYDYSDITYNRKKELLSNVSLKELRSVSTDQVPNYVIIIDEINRANISRVFGELITLIEKDKRSDGEIPLTSTLPSGDKFIVPSNLYIIGTMNTADKSIALLDIALRRRFEFIPMYPKYILNSNSPVIHDAIILEKINSEIIRKKGHDFTIGHSYFMGDDYKLKNTIDNKVIPLLLEYFMNDFDEVKKILKSAELDVENWPLKLVLND